MPRIILNKNITIHGNTQTRTFRCYDERMFTPMEAYTGSFSEKPSVVLFEGTECFDHDMRRATGFEWSVQVACNLSLNPDVIEEELQTLWGWLEIEDEFKSAFVELGLDRLHSHEYRDMNSPYSVWDNHADRRNDYIDNWSVRLHWNHLQRILISNDKAYPFVIGDGLAGEAGETFNSPELRVPIRPIEVCQSWLKAPGNEKYVKEGMVFFPDEEVDQKVA